MNANSVHIKEILESFLVSYTVGRYCEMTTELRSDTSPDIKIVDTLILDFTASSTMRNKFLLCAHCPFYVFCYSNSNGQSHCVGHPTYLLHLFRKILLVLFFLIIHLFTGAYIVWGISSPCPHLQPSPPLPLSSKQVLFCLYH
jgi:hypothetical protein